MKSRTNLVLPAVAVLVLAVAGCGSSGTSMTEERREQKYFGLSATFAEAVDREEWATAYGMTSKALQSRMSQEQFAGLHREARAEYGRPIGIEADDGFVSQEILADGWDDEFPGVPAKRRQAFTHATFVLERHEDGDVLRCYDLRLSWDDVDGADRIGWFEYAWCD